MKWTGQLSLADIAARSRRASAALPIRDGRASVARPSVFARRVTTMARHDGGELPTVRIWSAVSRGRLRADPDALDPGRPPASPLARGRDAAVTGIARILDRSGTTWLGARSHGHSPDPPLSGQTAGVGLTWWRMHARMPTRWLTVDLRCSHGDAGNRPWPTGMDGRAPLRCGRKASGARIANCASRAVWTSRRVQRVWVSPDGRRRWSLADAGAFSPGRRCVS
jgi:hypothetical protein